MKKISGLAARAEGDSAVEEDPEVVAFLRKTNREIADILFGREDWYQKLSDADKDLVAEKQAAHTMFLMSMVQKTST